MYDGSMLRKPKLSGVSYHEVIEGEVEKELRWIKNGKAVGPDEIAGELLKYGGHMVKERIIELIMKMWKEEEIPAYMKQAKVFLIPKCEGDVRPQNLRPITVVNSVFKLFDKVFTSRLTQDILNKNIMHQSQGGFTRDRCCIDQIFILETIIESRRKEAKDTYCAFLDLRKAFDSIDRNILIETMVSRGVDRKLIAIAAAMMDEEESMVVMNGELYGPMKIKRGVRQGGCSSPVCFNFFPNEIDDIGLGVQIGEGRRVGILLYADDIVLIAENAGMLRKLIDIADNWAKKYCIKINQDKSEIVVFGKSKVKWMQRLKEWLCRKHKAIDILDL
ncbi:unnamed protein product [Blepharisma stoltei]|uniref:Reverse transcriptase domain-containing protein n=1 Tax=Blepharisma stoltei TaxID=1481888 RepID=A0AAU9JTX1_9CILI|nr:unnamed protein product [Blepharisma stoltei]